MAVAAERRKTIPAQQRTLADNFPMSPQRATKRRTADVADVVGEDGKVGRAFPRHRAQVLCPWPLCFLSLLLRSLRAAAVGRPSAVGLVYLCQFSLSYCTKQKDTIPLCCPLYKLCIYRLAMLWRYFGDIFGDYAVSRKYCVPYAVVYLMQ